ncbi:alpha/beta fold hydrolase [Flavobacteriaceae bacterium R38]|nr:alpha/beta fold hydrolase [Flavobacteriaceae bacterium R38]
MKKLLIIILLFSYASMHSQKTVNYKSKDGLQITADLYEKKGADKFIVLFHQAGWSRGEYKEIAPKLNAMGYSCLAVDLRSGGKVNNVVNKTNKAAESEGKPTGFTDALQDVEASINYVKNSFKPGKLIIWGSSYSSSLVLKYGGDHPDAVDAILSFSPGEYFNSKNYVSKSAKNIKKPVFITSAANEHSSWKGIYSGISGNVKKSYLPKTKGNHGSRALWKQFDDSDGYWKAVTGFLSTI